MKSAWSTKKIGEVCDFQNGLWTGKKAPFMVTEVIRNTNFKNNDGSLNFNDVAEIKVEKNQLQSRLLQKGDIILERSGGGPTQPVGRVVYFEGESDKFSFSNFTTRIRAREGIELDSKYLWFFLHYFYKSGKTEAMQKKTTGIRNLTFSEYKDIEIPFPPLSEQKKIVDRLEKLLAKIKEAKRLRAQAQEATQNLLSAELHKIFEEGKKNGWEGKELGKICELNPKKSEIKDKPEDFLVSFIPMSAVSDDLQKIVTFDERPLGKVRKGYTYFCNNDVLFAKITPCMENGKVALAKNLKKGIGFGSTEFHVIRAEEKVLPEWIYYVIRQKFFLEEAEKHMTGSAGQKRVPVQFLEKYKILLPSLSEQKKIVARLDALSEKLKKLQAHQNQSAADLLALEQSILHKAFKN